MAFLERIEKKEKEELSENLDETKSVFFFFFLLALPVLAGVSTINFSCTNNF